MGQALLVSSFTRKAPSDSPLRRVAETARKAVAIIIAKMVKPKDTKDLGNCSRMLPLVDRFRSWPTRTESVFFLEGGQATKSNPNLESKLLVLRSRHRTAKSCPLWGCQSHVGVRYLDRKGSSCSYRYLPQPCLSHLDPGRILISLAVCLSCMVSSVRHAGPY